MMTEAITSIEELRELRVFISSDASDMQEEREHLLAYIFPEIESICRARGVEFTGIDLRHGLAPGDAQWDRLLRLSLDEIHLRRPYVIGLLGAQTGWMPDPAVVARDADLRARYPWLPAVADGERSLMEIEIERGILAQPGMADRALFYSRRGNAPAEAAASGGRRIAKLKERLKLGGFRVRESFPDPATLGSWVRDDLLAIIDRVFPVRFAPSYLEQERRAHEVFAASCRRGYVPRRDHLGHLDRYAASSDPPLVVSGLPGSGKSALLACWTAEYRKRHPERPVIVHHVGAGGASETGADVLRRLMRELRVVAGIEDPVPVADAEVIGTFPYWLAQGAPAGPLLVIDGVSALLPGDEQAEWLPRYIPSGVRLILSTTDPAVIRREERIGWPGLRLEPLSMSERLAIGERALAGRERKLNAEQIGRIVSDEGSWNPLYLRARLEEVMLFGGLDRMNRRAEPFAAARDVGELFERLLERLEREYGESLVRGIMEAIWGARNGLSEGELEVLVGCSRLDLSDLLTSLEFYLFRADGRLRFFHEQFRRGVEGRYLADPALRRNAHRRLADYFGALPDQERSASELLWQLREAEAWDILADKLEDVTVVRHLLQEEHHYELLGYWIAMGGTEKMADACRRIVSGAEKVGIDERERASLLNRLGNFLHTTGRYDDAYPMMRAAVELGRQVLGEEHHETAAYLYDLASLLHGMGRLDEAERYYRTALEVQRRVLGADAIATANTMDNLASVLCARGAYDEAEAFYRSALTIVERNRGVDHPDVAANLNNLAGLMLDTGRYEESEALCRRTLAIWERAFGREHPFRAVALNNLGALLQTLGRYEEAAKLFEEVLWMMERSLGTGHPTTATACCNLASAVIRADPGRSAELLERALEIQRRAYDSPHSDIALTLSLLGKATYLRGDLDVAGEMFDQAHRMLEVLFGSDHPDTALATAGMALIRRDRGDLDRAETLYAEALAVLERGLSASHVYLGTVLVEVAELYLRKGDAAAARAFGERSRAILAEHVIAGHPSRRDVDALLAALDGKKGRLKSRSSKRSETAADSRGRKMPE